MKALLIFPVLLFCGFFTPAKTAILFTSIFDIQTSLTADTAKAKQLLDEATTLIDAAQYEGALEMLDTAQVIYERMADTSEMPYAEVFHQKGRYFFRKGKYDMAVKSYERAIKIGQKIPRSERLVAFAFGNMAMVYQETGDLDLAMEYYQKSMDVWLTMTGAKYRPFILSLVNLGNVYDREGSYAVAEGFYRKALDMILKIPGMEPERIVASLTNVGNFCYLKGDYKRAIECHQRALEIDLKTLHPEHSRIAVSYNNLGNVFEATGDTERAKEYHQKALKIRLKTLHPDHPHLASSYNNLGLVYLSTGDYPKALECHQKALKIKLHTRDSSHPDVAQSIKNLGSIYSSTGDYERAIEYQQQALTIRLKTLGPVHPFVATSYNDLGIVYFIKGDFQQAIKHFQKALKIESAHPEKALYASSLFEVHARLRQFPEGEPLIPQALQALHYTGLSSLPQVEAVPILIKTLAAKGRFYQDYYAASQEQGHLHTARQSFTEASTAIAWQRLHLENPGSKTSMAKEAHGVYEGGIATSYLLQQLSDSIHFAFQAFDFAEKSKAILLYESMREADAMQFAGIPGNLLQQEYDLRMDITWFEKKKQEKLSTGLSETDTAVLAISSRLFDLHRSFEQLKEQFEKDYPDYFRLKYNWSVITAAEVQLLLRPEQTLVEFFTGDSSIFIFVVGKEIFRIIEVKKDFPLEEWITRFRQSIVENRTTGAAEYTGVAHQLYEKLILPVRDLLTEDLIIIPDGVLGYLPFEALVAEPPQKAIRFKNHHYLLRDYRISYCHSATLLREMLHKQHLHPPGKTLLAVAPYFDGDTTLLAGLFVYAEFRKDLQPLAHSGEEIYGIQKILGGDVLYGQTATEEQFTQSAIDYRILHLATHGKANDEAADYSFLAFTEQKDSLENELLYVRDLYNLSLNADLVTLSACETGIGKLQKGEGIISLARAFTYAGAKSIVTTLWSVQDESTKDLMIAFYKNLKNGMRKDEALRQAKLDYLAKNDHVKANPFYWAGVVAMGDGEALFSGK